MHYRCSLYSRKQNKSSFKKLVYESVDNTTVLNIVRMQSCSRRARNYMLLYKAVEALNLSGADGNDSQVIFNEHSILEGSMKLYRQLKKPKKRHRCVLENQMSDLRRMEKECGVMVSKMFTLKKCER